VVSGQWSVVSGQWSVVSRDGGTGGEDPQLITRFHFLH
jgi:hypothetical protein